MKKASILMVLAFVAGCGSPGTASPVPQQPSLDAVRAAQGPYRMIYQFGDKRDALTPYGLPFVSGGIVYGSTSYGGTHQAGAVFGVTTLGKEVMLASMPSYAQEPLGAPALLGGVLYGGARGTISTTPSALYSLTLGGKLKIMPLAPSQGNSPGELAALDGALFGTLAGGAVFRYTPSGSFKRLYGFPTKPGDAWEIGYYVLAANHTLYGVGCYGGAHDLGAVYSLSESGRYKALYSFRGGKDGGCPSAPLTLSNGVLYGTTSALNDVAPDYGTVFGITLGGKEQFVYRFKGRNEQSCQYPDSGVTFYKGALYGVCDQGGSQKGYLYRLTLSGQFTVLHEFTGAPSDGDAPIGLEQSRGTLYGLTQFGGKYTANNQYGGGTIFSYAP